jgi:hypothetical protein
MLTEGGEMRLLAIVAALTVAGGCGKEAASPGEEETSGLHFPETVTSDSAEGWDTDVGGRPREAGEGARGPAKVAGGLGLGLVTEGGDFKPAWVT